MDSDAAKQDQRKTHGGPARDYGGPSRDLDYIFEEIVGGNGWWQWRTTVVLFPLAWIGGYPLFLSIFAAYTPDHRCFIPGCDNSTTVGEFNTSFLDMAIPQGKGLNTL